MSEYFEFFFLESVKSTNDEIKSLSQNKKTSIALFSEEQTNGKGRSSNKWFSQKGDLTCSFFLSENFNLSDLGKINIMISVCILDALKEIFKNLEVKIKWPNDLYIGEKKLGGILLETKVSSGNIINLIIGVGINLISSPNINKYKTTKITNYVSEINSKELFLHLSKYIANYFTNFNKIDFLYYKKRWINYSKDIGKKVIIRKNEKIFNGKFKYINDNGELFLETEKKNILKFSFGEIV